MPGPTRYFMDWEFIEDGQTIVPLSLGLVPQDRDRAPLYLVNGDAQPLYGTASPWVQGNVLTRLRAAPENTVTLPELRRALLTYLGYTPERPARKASSVGLTLPAWEDLYVPDRVLWRKPSFWAWYGAYDHVTLAQLFGPMAQLPNGLPMLTHDLKTLCDLAGNPSLPDRDPEAVHNALDDALWEREVFEFLAGLPQLAALMCDSRA